MEPSAQVKASVPAEAGHSQQLQTILDIIDNMVDRTIYDAENPSENPYINYYGEPFLNTPSALLERFRDIMATIQRKTSKAVHEVGTKLGPRSNFVNNRDTADALLENLPGISPESELNQMLGRTLLGGKQTFKLRNRVDDDTATLSLVNPEDSLVVLQPTLRNVWVVQHAFARLQNYKEKLIREYFATADLGVGSSRKFAREYYEDLSIAQLPSKNKLGNLLDVKRSSHNEATHDMMIVLQLLNADGSPRYVEAVTEEDVNPGGGIDKSPYLVLPVAEESIKKLYDTYRSLRQATSEQRRATKDRIFAAKLPVDAMDELEKQFNIGGDENSDQGGGGNSKKRRRMLDDE